jgi:hypothetical protein
MSFSTPVAPIMRSAARERKPAEKRGGAACRRTAQGSRATTARHRGGNRTPANAGSISGNWGIHLTGVERRLGQWNVAMPAPTTLSLLGSFRLGSRLMQTAWTTWNGCDGLAASSARAAVVREDGGLGTAGSCVLDAVAAHQ